MHADQGMCEVLCQVLQNIGWTFTIPHPSPVHSGWQVDITLSSSKNSLRIFGETFLTPYMAWYSAYICALDYVDYVDRFLVIINIIHINYGSRS
jgi:hypothetical protein